MIRILGSPHFCLLLLCTTPLRKVVISQHHSLLPSQLSLPSVVSTHSTPWLVVANSCGMVRGHPFSVLGEREGESEREREEFGVREAFLLVGKKKFVFF